MKVQITKLGPGAAPPPPPPPDSLFTVTEAPPRPPHDTAPLALQLKQLLTEVAPLCPQHSLLYFPILSLTLPPSVPICLSPQPGLFLFVGSAPPSAGSV